MFLTSFGVKERYESEDCATARDFISRFNTAETRNDANEKYNAMRALSFFQCGESYAFLENQIKRSLNETDRCQAIMFLAWMMNPDYLPIIMKYAQRKNLSVQEKAAVATAFMVFGVHGTTPDLKERAIFVENKSIIFLLIIQFPKQRQKICRKKNNENFFIVFIPNKKLFVH